MTSQWFILLFVLSLIQFSIPNPINSWNLQEEYDVHGSYFAGLVIEKPDRWYIMSNEEIRSLFPTIDNSTWYHDSILNEKSNTTFPKILLPLFGFKKYLGELKDDENNPNIIGLVVSVENIQSNGICDSQNHKITVSENNTDVNVKSETSCYQASISSESSSILQLSMTINQIGFMEQFYSVPKLNMKYKYSFAVIYTDNVNKEVVNSFIND